VKAEDLFLDTMEDLRRRCDLRATEYDTVQVAGLVRRLLLDSRKLWAEVNREHRLRPVCTWVHVRVLLDKDPESTAPLLWLDPGLLSLQVPIDQGEDLSKYAKSTTLDVFLKHQVVHSGGEAATVQDLILHYANREGGVHYDPQPADVPALRRLTAGHERALRLTVLAVGRVVHRALEPLAGRVVLGKQPHPFGLSPMEEQPQ
jgi:hypothetical protein